MAPPGRKRVPKTVPKSPATPQAVAPYDFRTRDKTQPNGSKETPQGKKPVTDNTQGKRSSGSPAPDLRAEIKAIVEGFQDDVKKMFHVKRVRLLENIRDSAKIFNQTLGHTIKRQQEERQKMFREYCKQFRILFQEWSKDMQKAREEEDKLTKIFLKHRKRFYNTGNGQRQRLGKIKHMLDEFLKVVKELDNTYEQYLTDEDSAIKQGMAILENRILEEAKQHDLAFIQRSLESLLHG